MISRPKGWRWVSSPVRFGFGPKMLKQDIKELVRRLGASPARAEAALAAGLKAQADFNARLKQRGREVLSAMGPDDLAMVVISRPYNGADPGINLGLPQKMRSLGVWSIPMDFLDLDSRMADGEIAEMYWRYGQKILSAAKAGPRGPQALRGVHNKLRLRGRTASSAISTTGSWRASPTLKSR